MSKQTLKKYLIELKGYKCSICNISKWLNKPICLEIDHIDGNNKNNDMTNLRLLCPNCHSQTDTFRGKNINGISKISDEELLEALNNSLTISDALIKVGLVPKGLNYKRATRLINVSYSKTIDIKNSQFNTIWLNNGVKNIKIKKEQYDYYERNGWYKGRLSINYKTPSIKGKIWITNGINNRIVFANNIPDGYWKGRFIN